MSRIIEVLPDKSHLIQRSLTLILEKAHQAITERGQFTIALAGGGTPKPLYEAIAAQSLPWEKIHVFWGDERYVPVDHPDSNEGMARQAWLNHVPIPAENIHSMPTNAADPADAAAQHQQELQAFFQTAPGSFPQFDVILLGIGDDAHTASLFPHTAALQVCDRLITVGNKSGQPRITFTIPLINYARCVLFLVAGSSKQDALSHIFAPDDDPLTYPARFVQAAEVWWLLDQAAGEQVNNETDSET